MNTITVSACSRPLYTSLVLSALARCHGIDRWRVAINIDAPDGSENFNRVSRAVSPFLFDRANWRVLVTPGVGCNAAIASCMDYGFSCGGNFHVHLEDDTLPAADFLWFMEWASERFKDDLGVLTACGYARGYGDSDAAIGRRWFTPWGWGTWRDRWEEIRQRLNLASPVTWDVQTNQVRGDRVEVAPLLGRVQNIGEHGGKHNSPEQWFSEQFNPVWRGSVRGDAVCRKYDYMGAVR